MAQSSGGNPSSISIVPDDSVRDENTLLKIIKSGQRGTVIVIFSKRKINDFFFETLFSQYIINIIFFHGGDENHLIILFFLKI